MDLSTIHRIKAEAFEHSKVMDHLFQISDRYGPRLTASPNYDEAASWALQQLKDYGISSGHLEKWNPFGRRWSFDRFHIEIVQPQYVPLIGFPLAWSAGTDGPVTAEAVLTPFNLERPCDRRHS